MQSSSQGRYQGYPGYQGYPYVNPVVNDVPSVDAATASRWANLPRRPVQLPGPSGVVPGTSGTGQVGSSQIRPPPSRDEMPSKKDIDESPVVYTPIPEAGSEVSQRIESPKNDEPQFVQDTIMYDPFENRRIDRPKEDGGSLSSASGSTYSDRSYHGGSTLNRPSPRPNTLNLASPNGSAQSPASSTRLAPSIPNFMTKESLVYGGQGADGFPMSPIPISEFPRPPPAYTEVAIPQNPGQSEAVHQTQVPQQPTPLHQAPPPTQVTYNPHPVNLVGAQHTHRKNLVCQYCGIRVNTLVVKEVGYMTHLIAFVVLIFCLPLVVVVYLSDCFKHRNHYCPNCNRMIGYVKPIFGENVHYVT